MEVTTPQLDFPEEWSRLEHVSLEGDDRFLAVVAQHWDTMHTDQFGNPRCKQPCYNSLCGGLYVVVVHYRGFLKSGCEGLASRSLGGMSGKETQPVTKESLGGASGMGDKSIPHQTSMPGILLHIGSRADCLDSVAVALHPIHELIGDYVGHLSDWA